MYACIFFLDDIIYLHFFLDFKAEYRRLKQREDRNSDGVPGNHSLSVKNGVYFPGQSRVDTFGRKVSPLTRVLIKCIAPRSGSRLRQKPPLGDKSVFVPGDGEGTLQILAQPSARASQGPSHNYPHF